MAIVGLFAAMLAAWLPAQQIHQPDAEGFIRHWLIVAPLPIDGESGAWEIDRPFFRDEALAKPKPGDSIEVNRSWYTWRAHESETFYVDFLQSFGSALSDYAAAYAVTYVHAPDDMAVTLAMGSNDQGKVWLNGREVIKATTPRGLERDSDRAEVTLVKGQNVVVFKVVNEVNNWQGCLRFLRGGSPVSGLSVSLTAQ